MSTANKLIYLNTTKNKIKDTLECGGAEITTEPFREYPEVLYDQYVDAAFNGAQAIYAGMPKVTAQGTGIALDNTVECKLALDLKGNTYQDSTTGKNLFNLLGITPITYKTSYQRSANSIIQTNMGTYCRTSWEINNLIVGQQYTLSCKFSNQNQCSIRLDFYDSTNTNYVKQGSATTNTSGDLTETFEATETTHYIRLYSNTTSTSNSNSVTFSELQLEKGSSSSSYEPYTNGASPNPDYPQDIHVVSGDNTIEICGKNLFPVSTITTQSTYLYPCKVGDKFTLSFKGYGTAGDKRVFLRTYNGDFATNLDSYVNNETITLTGSEATYTKTITSTTDGFVYFRTAASYSNYVLSNLQLEKGSTSSEYEPYQGQNYPINLPVENLFDKTNVTNGYRINSDGTPLSSGDYSLSDYIKVQPNATYTRNITISTNNAVALYDSNKTFISRLTSGNTFITTNETYYVRTSIITTSLDDLQLTKGNIASHVSTTPIELCKIGDYQDYIYKEDDKWYLHKEIGKVVLDGSESWQLGTHNINTTRWFYYVDFSAVGDIGLCNYFTLDLYANRSKDNIHFYIGSGTLQIRSTISDIDDFKTWLSNNKPIVDYVLATSTDTEITDTTLISQLEAIKKSYDEQTNISQTNNDLPFVISASAIKEYAEAVD